MKRRGFIKITALGVASSLIPGIVYGESSDGLPNVLIIGDSISMGYTKYVKEMLKGKANVFRPTHENGSFLNCHGTTRGVERMDEWLSINKWDVIHFNFGLHDLKHVDPLTGKNSTDPKHPQQADLKIYKKNMEQLVGKLKATEAKLIFATTTPFPDLPYGPYRRANQPQKYNRVALRIMKKNDIAINNLHDFCLPQLEHLQIPDNVHFTDHGSKLLAEQVVASIMHALR
jgi:acyl-CoA thioesterase-1